MKQQLHRMMAALLAVCLLVTLAFASFAEEGVEIPAPEMVQIQGPAPEDAGVGQAPGEAIDGERESGEDVRSEMMDDEVPELQEVALSSNGAESNDEANEGNQASVEQKVDFTAKKIELNMDKGTTLLVIPENGTVQGAWNVPKAAQGNVKATLRADGVTEITAKNPIKKVKLSAKVLLSTGKTKKISMTLYVNDPNAPRTIAIVEMPADGVPVGRVIDLSEHIVLDPPSATLDSVEIKVTGAGKLDSSQYPYGMITTKKGSAKIAVTSRSDKKVKMKPYSLKVLENKTAKMTPKPGKADMPNGWTMWPLSLEVKGNVLKCQFNVLNGTDDKMAQIENMTIKIAEDRWGNVIAEGSFPKIKAAVAKQKSKTVKFDLKINPENMKGVFLPEAWADKTLHFLINQGAVKLTGKKGESADFVYCKYFPEPGSDASISLDRTEATLTVGGKTLTLVAATEPADLAYGWFSSDENVATVVDGVVTPIRAGTATITAAAADGSAQAECAVTVLSLAESVDFPEPLTLNESIRVPVVAEDEGILRRFSFVPEESGEYVFHCSDVKGQDGFATFLFDSKWKLLRQAEDDMEIPYVLRAGETYYFSIYYSIYETGAFYVGVKRNSGLIPEQDDGWDLSEISVNVGEAVTLQPDVNVAGACQLDYQWYVIDNDWVYDDYWQINWNNAKPISGATQDHYTMDPARSGYYACQVSDGLGGHASKRFEVNVQNDLNPGEAYQKTVTTGQDQPANLNATCTAKLGQLSYQWYEGEFTEIWGVYEREIDAAASMATIARIEDATAATWVTPPISGNTTYTCLVEDEYGNHQRLSVNVEIEGTPSVQLKVHEPVATSWGSYRCDAGQEMKLEALIEGGTGEYTFQWYRDGNPIAGATNAVYQAVAVEGRYTCQVADAHGRWIKESDSVRININGSLQVRDVKSGQDWADYIAVIPGGSCSWSWEDDYDYDDYETYQWYRDGEPIEGATQAAYTEKGIVTATCISSKATTAQGRTESRLWVVFPCDRLTMTAEAVSGGDHLTYQWYCGDDSTPIEGATQASYSLSDVLEENYYKCEITDAYGRKERVIYYIGTDEVLTAEPVGGSKVEAAAGDEVKLEVKASCWKGDLTYQWYRYENRIAGATKPVYTVTPDASLYKCLVSDEYGNQKLVEFYITALNGFEAVAGGEQNFAIAAGETANLTVNAKCSKGSLSYQWYYEKPAVNEEEVASNGIVLPREMMIYEYGSDDKESAGVPIANATLPAYAAEKSGVYRCEVSDSFGNEAAIQFSVAVENHLSALCNGEKEVELNIEPGTAPTLTVQASCDKGGLTYQWYHSSYDWWKAYNPVRGAAEKSYAPGELSGRHWYYVEVSDAYGNIEIVRFIIDATGE